MSEKSGSPPPPLHPRRVPLPSTLARSSPPIFALVILVSCLVVSIAFLSPPPRPVFAPQPRLPSIHLHVCGVPLFAEVADSRSEREFGLMGRASVAEGEGMLFVFPSPTPLEFWMRGTGVPLSVAFMDPQGVIIEIYDLKPYDESRVGSLSGNLLYALEVPMGWFSRNGLGPGSVVERLPTGPPPAS